MAIEIPSIWKNKNYELSSLVWVDSQANNTLEYLTLQIELRNMINYLKICETIDQCEEYIQLTSKYDRIILMMNDQFAPESISRIYSFRQISSIYIYGEDKEAIEQWRKQYPKIKHVVLSSGEFLSEIQSEQQKLDETFAFSIFKINPNKEQSSAFVYFPLIIDCLLHMDSNLPTPTQLFSFSREIYLNHPNQLDLINQFEQTYSPDQALNWYQRNICFSKILNKALCTEDINTLFFFRFFLRDIYKQLNQHQYTSSIRVYRCQYLSKDELELFRNSIGEYISIRSFFSMKIDRQSALADGISADENLQQVLFEIDLDPQLKSFSNLNPSEILIIPGAIFRLIDIQFGIIQLKLCSENDENLKPIFDYTKTKIGYDTQQINFITLGNILWKMEKFDIAVKYYLHLIDLSSSDSSNHATFYYNLGHIYSDANDYAASLKSYHQSLEIWKKSKDANLGNNYNAIATIYWKQEDYKHASESFNQALEIFEQIYGEDHPTVAMCWNNMATVISHEKNYTKALNYYLKALTLFRKYLPVNHPNLASLHCNISTSYRHLQQMDLALEHLKSSLNISEQSLPYNHPNILMMLKNIAFLYEQKGDFPRAVKYYEKISNIYRQTVQSTDPTLRQNEEKIQLLLSKHSLI